MNRILEVFHEYGLSEEEVKQHIVFVTDRGSNIKYGLIRNGFKRLTCYAHILHNLVSAMLAEKDVKEVVKKANALSSYVKNSGMNTKLKISLKCFTTTRWNSIYTMLNAIITSYQDVYDLLLEKQRFINDDKLKNGKQPNNEISDMITTLNRSDLIEICNFLQPFKVNVQLFT